MIRLIDIRLNAAHPELRLPEAVTYTGAPSTALIRGVPPNYGRWAITAVYIAATFPDGSTTTRAAVQSANGVWVATLPATATSGRTTDGFRVIADGIDENGEAVTGYILAVADFAVASLDVTPAPEPGGVAYALRYFDALPDPAKKGDVIRVNGDLKFYNGTAWQPFTDLSNYYTAEQTDEAIDKLAAYYITADAQGNPFATHAALVNAQTYYSGGAARTPTRNDYAVVSADEMHGGAEWRYIYAVDAQGVGQWEPQYAVEGVIAYDNTVTRTSANGVKSSGIWSAIWGALTALPAGFSSLYDWVVDQLAGKLSTSGGTVTGSISMVNGALDAGDVQTRSMFDFLQPGQSVKSLDAPENSGKALTDADLQDSSSALGVALAGKQDALSQAQLDAVNSGITAAKVSAYDGYAATIAGKASAADLRYALVTKAIDNGAVSLDDRAINAVAVSSSLASLTVNFPAATSGKARDFGLRLTVASGITTAPQLVLPQGVVCENADGTAPEIGADGAATILYFTETAAGVFLVKGEVVTAIS